jgi:hypothetical protein
MWDIFNDGVRFVYFVIFDDRLMFDGFLVLLMRLNATVAIAVVHGIYDPMTNCRNLLLLLDVIVGGYLIVVMVGI